MSYLIDGHNLIPKVSGLSLRQMDDEARLVELLQVFCRVRRKKVEVYFDQAPPGRAGTRHFGMVTAHFVRQGLAADEVILERLNRLQQAARNWIVVTSEGHIQVQARSMLAQVISSEEFSVQLSEAQLQTAEKGKNQPEPINDEEVEEWLRIFRARGRHIK
ncbi:MAG: NYN domain-containing protein [Anaerolineaceae bacterium]|nr:NYN domain-containing protein [Anaerolineaceae bacterium]